MTLNSLEPESDDSELATVIGLYALRELTLGEAAQRVGVSKIRMQDILNEAGVSLRLGPRTKEDAQSEVNVARRANE